ncbi:MAG: hypothetical protein ABIR33_13500 [Pyrinomonadaceae bacterium]
MGHDPNYTKWAQRSLNRLIGTGIRADGDGTATVYREGLAKFKTIYGVKEMGLADDQIGSVCQDLMIRLNSTKIDGGLYVDWLKKVVPGAPQYANGTPGEFNNSVKEFQKGETAKGNHLVQDGLVGFKTEYRLIQRSKVDPPGSTPTDVPKKPVDPFIQHLNSMTQDKRYGFMMELAAKRWAEAPADQRIKDLAQKMRRHWELGIPRQYFFEERGLRRLIYGDSRVAPDQDPKNRLTRLMQKGSLPWSYGYYDLSDNMVQILLQDNFMSSALEPFIQLYVRPFMSMEDYEQRMQRFYQTVKDVHDRIDIGIGRIQYYKNKEHGDPNARLAHNLAKGLSKNESHAYSAYRGQMPGEWWEYESPLPVGRKW